MKVLVVKTSALGDVIHCFPVIDHIMACHPDAQVDWVIEKGNAALVQAHPLVKRVLTIDSKQWKRGLLRGAVWRELFAFRRLLRERRYDYVLDLQGNIKSGLVTAMACGDLKVGFGRKRVAEWPNMLATERRYNPPSGTTIRDDYLYFARRCFGEVEVTGSVSLDVEGSAVDAIFRSPQLHKKPRIIVCPGSAWRNKKVTAEALHQFLLLVAEEIDPSYLFVWGSAEEKSDVETLHHAFPHRSVVVDKLTLPVLQKLMASVDLVVAMDSLPLHLAATTTTPTFSVFGASSVKKYKPHGQQHLAFQGQCPYGKTFEKRCPILRSCPTGSCIRTLTGDQLFKSFVSWWEQCIAKTDS